MRWNVIILLALLALPNFSQAQTGKTNPEASSRQSPVKKEELRYYDRPFSYWQNYARTELSAEKRIQTLHAMAAFGARGYGKKAAKVILEIVKEYGKDAYKYDEKPQTPDQKVVAAAVWSFRKIGANAAPVLYQQISNANVKRFASDCLSIDDGELNAEFYILAVHSKDKQLRTEAIIGLYDQRWALQRYFEKKDAKPFLDALIRFVKEEEIPYERTRMEHISRSFPALHVIAALSPKAKSRFPELKPLIREILRFEGLAEFGRSLRQEVLSLLNEMDIGSEQMVPYLTEFLQYGLDQEKKGNKEPRCVICYTKPVVKDKRTVYVTRVRRRLFFKDTVIKELASHGPRAKKAMPLLMDAYKTGDKVTRTFVAKTLSAIGPAAKSAVPVLREALKANDAELRQAAAAAIRQITGEKGTKKGSL